MAGPGGVKPSRESRGHVGADPSIVEECLQDNEWRMEEYYADHVAFAERLQQCDHSLVEKAAQSTLIQQSL